MVLVQDKSTAATLSVVEQWLPPTPALCASACVSGAVGALAVGCQIEGLITRAHGTGHTVTQSFWATHAAYGWQGILVPHGAMAIAAVRVVAARCPYPPDCRRARRARRRPGCIVELCIVCAFVCVWQREVPYAGCLFFLSGWIRSKVHGKDLIGTDGAGVEGAPQAADGGGGTSGGSGWLPRVGRDLMAAALTAAIAGPISHAPSVIAAHQQAHAVGFAEAVAHLCAEGGGGLRGFFRGLVPRTASLTGSLFVMPLTIEWLQPLVEKNRHRWRA